MQQGVYSQIALDWYSSLDVRCDSDSDHILLRSEMTRSANRRLMHRSKKYRYSMASSRNFTSQKRGHAR
jgi:hypothetical protein